jgi:predicted Zn-dependent protease
MHVPRSNTAITVILFAGAVNSGFARSPRDVPRPGFNLYSRQQDIELGKQAAAEVKEQFQQVQSPELQAYVTRVGERLAKTPTASNSGFPFSFTLLNDKAINAFALPGGPTFVFSGLIKASDSEAELAGVLAHEISHVVLRHGTNQASKAKLIERPALVIGAINSLTLAGRLINVGLGLQLDGIFLKYSRTDESEADALGARIMAEAGYDPVNLARFFQKIEAQGGPGVPEFLSDHPSPGNRIEAVEAEARSLPHRVYVSDDREFDRVKVAIAELPPPPDLRPEDIDIAKASVTGDSKLSARQFSIEYPSTWHVHGDSDSPLLALAPDKGIVIDKNGAPAIGYGSVLGYFFVDPGRSSLDDATSDMIRHLHIEEPDMHYAGKQNRATVDKQPALMSQLTSDSPFGGTEMDMLVTVARPEGLFYLIFVSPDQNWNDAHFRFERMVESIRFVR